MKRRSVALFTALALGAASCSTDTVSSDAGAASVSAPTVVATTSIWADIVGGVACNDEVNVVNIIPAGADPHTLSLIHI